MKEQRETQHEMDTDAEAELRLTLEHDFKPGARIKVIGVGGGGSNAVNRMLAAASTRSTSSSPIPTRRRCLRVSRPFGSSSAPS